MNEHQRGNREPGVVGYIRVWTDQASRAWTDQASSSRLDYNAQREAILAESQRRNLPLLYFFFDLAGPDGSELHNLGFANDGLTMALRTLAEGHGSALVVAEFERLAELADDVVLRARRQGWELIALDMRPEAFRKTGVRRARGLSARQRRLISQRTIEALAIKRAQGIQLGRPPGLPTEVVQYILQAHALGWGWSAIAQVLNEHHVPTAQGGRRWYPSTIRAIVLGRSG